MDKTVVVAIIGALATIIAALIIGLFTLKSSSSSKNDQLEAILHTAIILGKRGSNAEDSEERAFIEENLDQLSQVESQPTACLEQAAITAFPDESNLTFVVQKDNPRPAINIRTKLTNNGEQVGIVDGLETILTGPAGVSFKLVWHLFYGYSRGGLQHTMSSYIHPLAIPPGDSKIVGIQFVGPDLGLDKLYSWPTGKYQVEMTGTVIRSSARQSKNFSSKFNIEISSMDIDQLKRWIKWDDADWAKFPDPGYPDPDKAAGHLIKIESD